MATLLRLGPKDHGRELTWDELAHADLEEGARYELIDGRLYVAPAADLPHDSLENWLSDELRAYAKARPDVINRVTSKARVFVSGRPGETVPEPDLTVYHDFPFHVS